MRMAFAFKSLDSALNSKHLDELTSGVNAVPGSDFRGRQRYPVHRMDTLTRCAFGYPDGRRSVVSPPFGGRRGV